MEPWYNMNKLEQVIGRAVRNFSHKLLPFEKRNVQIYLHGTMLEDPEEEAVDLYIYRLAEKKAIKIGKVARVLKENAVDCILNHSQTNFNFENFKDQQVTQELSNGLVIENFPVGDIPYSPGCDYQETTDYECVKPGDVEEDSNVNESFMNTQSERIGRKIAEMYKTNLFYTMKDFESLGTSEDVYYALTKLMNITIYDRYNRPGKLVNTGQYYLFQPIELEESSLFEKVVPIDAKLDNILFNINPTMRKANINENYENEMKELDLPEFTEEELGNEEAIVQAEEIVKKLTSPPKPREERRKKPSVIGRILDSFTKAREIAEGLREEPADSDDWYYNCGIAMNILPTKCQRTSCMIIYWNT
jgi:hypothetical protein